MDREPPIVDKIQMVTFTQAEYEEVTLKVAWLKKTTTFTDDQLIPFVGHGGPYKAIQSYTSRQDYIEADHAPQKTILDYIDKHTLEHLPVNLRKKIRLLRELENKVDEFNKDFGEANPSNELRNREQKDDPANDNPQKPTVVSNFERYKSNLIGQMAVLSLPLKLHVKLPTGYTPPSDITNLKDMNAEAAEDAMKTYYKKWTEKLRDGIRNKFITENKKQVTEEKKEITDTDWENIWEENFDHIRTYWLDEDPDIQKTPSKRKYMNDLRLIYYGKFLTTSIYYVKTPEKEYKRLIGLYVNEYTMLLKDFDRYKPGLISYLQTSKNFGWITETDVQDLIAMFALNETEQNLLSDDDLKSWQSVDKLIQAYPDNEHIILTDGTTYDLKEYKEYKRLLNKEKKKAEKKNRKKVESNRKPEVDDSAEVTERKPALATLQNKSFLTCEQDTELVKTIKSEVTVTGEELNSIMKTLEKISEDMKEVKEQNTHFRMELSKSKNDTNDEPKSNSDSASPCEMHVALKHFSPKLPLLTDKNRDATFLKFPTGDIKFKDIKSVQPILSPEESDILVKSGVSFDTLNWIDDSVLAGFLFKISNFENQGIITYTPAEVMAFFEVKDEETASRTKENTNNDDHHQLFPCSQILFPYHINEDHWILIILKPKKREIIVLDPVGSFQLDACKQEKLKTFFNKNLSFEDGTVWEVKYPDAALSVGQKALECGPFVCFYAEASVRGWSFLQMPNVKWYRQRIISTLIGSCQPLIDNTANTTCLQCQKEFSEESKCSFCSFCGVKKHKTCLRSCVFTSEYNICF